MEVPGPAAVLSARGVRMDDHYYLADKDELEEHKTGQRLPPGMSAYQAAWMEKKSEGESGTELQDGHKDKGDHEVEMDDADDMDDASAYNGFRANTEQERKDDLEFPDEIEISPDVNARDR